MGKLIYSMPTSLDGYRELLEERRFGSGVLILKYDVPGAARGLHPV